MNCSGYTTTVTNTVPCDQVVVANVVVPSGPQLAQAKGNVDLVGEFPLTVPDWPPTGKIDYPGKTFILAYEGRFSNFQLGMGEVRLNIFSTGSQFRNPQIYNDYGAAQFNGTNFLGNPDSYGVTMSYALGTPDYFTNQGLIVMYLPQGTYSVEPTLESLNPDGSTSTTKLRPVSFTVGVGQRISLQSDLQVQLIAPACAGAPSVPISGQVLGTNSIVPLTMSVNGGPATNLCSKRGVNPSFSALVPVNPAECADTSVTVTALGQFGHTASTTSTIQYDTVPPVIHCPGDITIGCARPDGAVVNFNVTATDDSPGPVNVVCTPPSGSVFPVGTTTVQCLASDVCGNASSCSFNVTVSGSGLAIKHAVQISWECAGVLQGAPTPAGPWTDIPGATSPYYTVLSFQQQFLRVRNLEISKCKQITKTDNASKLPSAPEYIGVVAQQLQQEVPEAVHMFETAVGWTVKWTVSAYAGREDSSPGLLSTLLSILRSKRMVLDGRNRRNRLSGWRVKSFENS